MKSPTFALAAITCALLGGCAVVPVEPYPYGPPAAAYGPPVTVVIRPAPRYYGHYDYGRPHRYWR